MTVDNYFEVQIFTITVIIYSGLTTSTCQIRLSNTIDTQRVSVSVIIVIRSLLPAQLRGIIIRVSEFSQFVHEIADQQRLGTRY